MLIDAIVHRAGSTCLQCAVRRLRSMLTLPSAARRLALGPLLRDSRGSAAVEFALVAPPFILLMVGTLEISIMFFTGSVIEGATKEVARQIRTGQIQESADPLAAFQSEVCDALINVIECTDVVFNVKTFSSFSVVSMPIEMDEDGNIINTTFTPGGSGAVTVVRTVYRWDFVTPMIGHVIPAGLGGHTLVSTVAFQNEPYNVD